MAATPTKPISKRDGAFWRAYLEILSERVPLVDRWRDGSVTWHPRVVQKLLWYSDVPNTLRNRGMAHDWLMEHAAQPVRAEGGAGKPPPPACKLKHPEKNSSGSQRCNTREG